MKVGRIANPSYMDCLLINPNARASARRGGPLYSKLAVSRLQLELLAQRRAISPGRAPRFMPIVAPVCRDAAPPAIAAIPYNPGGQKDIVRVRVCFLHKTINPALGLKLARTPDGMRKIYSVAIFRNEPFVP